MSDPQWLRDARRNGLTITEGAAAVKQNKYRNRKVELHGMKFDSKKEADRWLELGSLALLGVVRNIRVQVPFQITVNGVKVCKYVADFVYDERIPGDEWREVIEDVKGWRTPVYRLKKKLMLAVLGRHVREV